MKVLSGIASIALYFAIYLMSSYFAGGGPLWHLLVGTGCLIAYRVASLEEARSRATKDAERREARRRHPAGGQLP